LIQNFLPFGAGEGVEKAAVELGGGVGMLVPVRGQAAKLVPVVGLALGHLGEIAGDVVPFGPRHRMLEEEVPVARQNHRDGGHVHQRAAMGEEGHHRVPQADLRQHVLEGEVGHRRAARPEEDAEENQDHRADENVPDPFPERISPRLPARHREGNGRPHHEHERGLDQVPGGTAGPFHVLQLLVEHAPQGFPGGAVRGAVVPRDHLGVGVIDARDREPSRRHRQHDEPAIRVERDEPPRRPLFR